LHKHDKLQPKLVSPRGVLHRWDARSRLRPFLAGSRVRTARGALLDRVVESPWAWFSTAAAGFRENATDLGVTLNPRPCQLTQRRLRGLPTSAQRAAVGQRSQHSGRWTG